MVKTTVTFNTAKKERKSEVEDLHHENNQFILIMPLLRSFPLFKEISYYKSF